MRRTVLAVAAVCMLQCSCVSLFSRVGMRGTNDYPVYTGVANHVDWIGSTTDAFDWVLLALDGPLCLVLDTALLPVDLAVLAWKPTEAASRDPE